MADVTKRAYDQDTSRLHADMERGIARVREDLVASSIAYSPARSGDWAGTPPTTVAEAVDRLAYHISSGGGTTPIVELP